MTYQTQGKLAVVFEMKNINDRFKKRDLVLEISENPEYPQYVTFQLSGDRCGLIDSFSIGEEIKLSFNLRGNKWNSPDGSTKYFNSLDIWKIEIPKIEYGAEQSSDQETNSDEPPF